MSTNNLIRFGDEVFDSAWYELPTEVQKSYILIIANAGKPIYYDGLRMVSLNLPTFARVCTLSNSFILVNFIQFSAFSFFLHRF